MFTGIVQGMGRIRSVEPRGGDVTMWIETGSVSLAGVEIGGSIAVNGCCLTAIELLSGAGKVLAVSSLYYTEPVGYHEQEDFINAVAGVLTQLSAQQLLTGIRGIEAAAGRVRSERWGPRTLDLDLLVFGDQRIDTPELTVPHPGIAERGFVLAPLVDIAPTLQVPGVGRAEQLLQRLPDDGIAEVIAA